MVRFFQVWFVTICEKSIGLLKPCELNTAEIATTANWWCCGDIALENHVILYPKYIVELRTTTTFTEESLCYLDAKMSKTGLRFQARNSKLNTETLISFHFKTQNARQWKATCKIVKYLLNARWGLVTEGPRRAVRDNSFFLHLQGWVGFIHRFSPWEGGWWIVSRQAGKWCECFKAGFMRKLTSSVDTGWFGI